MDEAVSESRFQHSNQIAASISFGGIWGNARIFSLFFSPASDIPRDVVMSH